MWLPLFITGILCFLDPALPSPLQYQDFTRRSSKLIAPDTTDDSYRLPRNVIPYKYDLQIEPIINPEDRIFEFRGHSKILMKCKSGTDRITMHGNNLVIDSSSVRLWRFRTTEHFNITRIVYDTSREFVHFYVNDVLTEGRLYYIEMDFTGPLIRDNRGLYLSYYYEGTKKYYLATTQMEPTDARKAFPCFDEPDLKAIFDIQLIRKEGWTALSNGEKIGQTHLYGDVYKDHFKATPKMSTYLVAMVVSQFRNVTTVTSKGTKFRVWARPEDIHKTQLALNDGSAMQTFFEDYLEFDFPMYKQDNVEVPHFSFGAMENWGLIIYRENYLTWDPVSASEWWKKTVIETVAHELAHQWFGNIVTLHWWSDIWLNEGFANFFQYIGSGYRYPDWNQRQTMVLHSMRSALVSDSYRSSSPIHTPVTTRSEIIHMFGTISYSKGGAVLRMMEHFLGKETFRKGLVNYLNQHKYSNTVPDDLWFSMGNQSLSECHTVDVKGVMDTWIYQKNYPVVMVTQDNNGRLHVTQNRFLLFSGGSDDEENPSPFGYVWKIPFTFTTSSERNFNKSRTDVVWIDQPETVIQTQSIQKDDWIIANVQQNGFYRVNYDETNWIRLVDQLTTDRDVIHPLNRASLLEDASALHRAGGLSDEILNKINDAVTNEENVAPLTAAISEFRQLDGMLSGTKVEGKFKKFVQGTIKKQYNKYGLDSSPRDIQEMERKNVLVEAACDFGLNECVVKAKKMYRDWMYANNEERIPPEVQKTVFCTAITEGGEEEWEFAFQRYKTTQVAAERLNLIEGMACSKKSTLLLKYLRLTLEPETLPVPDAVKAIDAVSKNPVGRKVVWSFINENWSIIEKRFGKDSLPLEKLLRDLSSSFHTDSDVRQMRTFQSAHKSDLGTSRIPLKQDLEKTKANVQWMKNKYPAVERLLNRT